MIYYRKVKTYCSSSFYSMDYFAGNMKLLIDTVNDDMDKYAKAGINPKIEAIKTETVDRHGGEIIIYAIISFDAFIDNGVNSESNEF